jgi:hypothetical protein
MAARRLCENPRVLSLIAPVVMAACLVHPADLDREVGRRALPWLPPDLARQVVKHEREFGRGAAAAAAWPASYHRSGGQQGVERAIALQCDRLVAAIRSRQPFSEVVAGLGALAHLAMDCNSPFVEARAADAHTNAFGVYLGSAAPRIPLVFYGQQEGLVHGRPGAVPSYVASRSTDAATLGGLVRDDLDRVGGPSSWRRLDDRSTSFGAASLVLNHATSDFANLASWVWQSAGGLVPEVRDGRDTILIWTAEPQPREKVPRWARREGTTLDTASTRLGFRQTRP